MLPELLEPMDLALTSLIPAASSTVRTDEPAITPVPCDAGMIRTLPAPKTPKFLCGTVVPTVGTYIKFFFASSSAFLTASGIS